MEPVDVLKALSNPTRLQILTWLKEPEKHFPPDEKGYQYIIGVCVGDIADKVGLSQSTVSEYLAVLHRAGLVTSQRCGQWTFYKRNEATIREFVHFMAHDL
ncbi:MAG: metalloregulator ArsR/SmtB family transcription factor [Chloroflexota bacterium]